MQVDFAITRDQLHVVPELRGENKVRVKSKLS